MTAPPRPSPNIRAALWLWPRCRCKTARARGGVGTGDDPTGTARRWRSLRTSMAVISTIPPSIHSGKRRKRLTPCFCPSEPGGRGRAHERLQSGQSDRQSDRHLVGLCQVDLRRCLGALSRLKLLLAHGGGFLPYTWGRLDRGYRIQNSSSARISKPPSEYVKLLYFDTITHSPMALEYLITNFGAEHVLLGSDYPMTWAIPSRSDRWPRRESSARK